MAKNNSRRFPLRGGERHMERNGCKVASRDDIVTELYLGMQAIDRLETILVGIKRIVGDREPEIARLVKMGEEIAWAAHNDLDVIRENAECAGVAGELVPEAPEQHPAYRPAPGVRHG